MSSARRHGHVGRAIGSLTALVFALVVSVGGWAHAHHEALHTYTHDATVISCLKTDGTPTLCDSHVIEFVSADHPSDAGEHTCCADLNCHGGVGLANWNLPTSVPMLVRERFVIANQTLDAWPCLSLERPPRTAVQI